MPSPPTTVVTVTPPSTTFVILPPPPSLVNELLRTTEGVVIVLQVVTLFSPRLPPTVFLSGEKEKDEEFDKKTEVEQGG